MSEIQSNSKVETDKQDEAYLCEMVVAESQTASETTVPVTKRKVKLTAKALLFKIEDLEKTRKSKLNKAAELKRIIRELVLEPGYKAEVKSSFKNYQILLNDAKGAHNTLLELLPGEEVEK